MEKKEKYKINSNISNFDKVTMVVAIAALLATLTSSYYQLFHRSTELNIGNVSYKSEFRHQDSLYFNSDTLYVYLDVLFINSGDIPVAITNSSTFLSVEKSIPGPCYGSAGQWGAIAGRQDSTSYTFGCSEGEDQFIFEPRSITKVPMKLGVDIRNFIDLVDIKDSIDVNEKYKILLGCKIAFTDSKLEKKIWEELVRELTFTLTKESECYKFNSIASYTVDFKSDIY